MITHKIIDTTGKEVQESTAIKAYFGMRPGDTLSGFMSEVKSLSVESKTELAQGAAKELGWTVVPA